VAVDFARLSTAPSRCGGIGLEIVVDELRPLDARRYAEARRQAGKAAARLVRSWASCAQRCAIA
jgi:hypothetical protein